YGWLEEEEDAIDRLLEQRKKLDKLRTQVVQALHSYNRQVREFEHMQSLPADPTRKQDCKTQEQRIWYALQELRTLQNSVTAFRNRPASPEGNENQIASDPESPAPLTINI